MLTGPTPPTPPSEPRRGMSWPDVVGILGALALILGALCFVVWVVFG